MAERSRVRATVWGRVQGVGFRFFVVDWARALGLAGYVSNLPGGTAVLVEAEGERPGLDRLVEELRRGPPSARVERVEVAWLDDQGTFKGFGIRR